MIALWRIFRHILRDQRTSLIRGAVLSLVVLVMGVSLLGLSGWFITAAAAAGLAGVGAVFDVFRPSAMVRFLALGRAAARYGERILTHDATLRALETLRTAVLRGLMGTSHSKMVRLRGAQALNRLTADIDALDGVPLRLVLPLIAGSIALLGAFVALWALVDLRIALWVFLGNFIGAAAIFWHASYKTAPLSRRGEAASHAFRSRFIDLIQGRRDLAVLGQLIAQRQIVLAADDRRHLLRQQQDKESRHIGAALQMLSTAIAGGTLWLGVSLTQAQDVGPAFAALGFFAALALAETIAPLRRAANDLGRMAEAARRVARDMSASLPIVQTGWANSGTLEVEAVTLLRPQSDSVVISGLSLHIIPGETVALTGASGTGKSTLLLAIAGLHPVEAGRVSLGGVDIAEWNESDLRSAMTLLPQRSVLMTGTVAEALRIAAPASENGTLEKVLDAVQLTQALAGRGGIHAQIGPRGESLSGGEARRLVLARALLRQPKILLLDEPTEGLDEPTAAAVLRGVRSFLPDAAILIASHRTVETDFADRLVDLNNSH